MSLIVVVLLVWVGAIPAVVVAAAVGLARRREARRPRGRPAAANRPLATTRPDAVGG